MKKKQPLLLHVVNAAWLPRFKKLIGPIADAIAPNFKVNIASFAIIGNTLPVNVLNRSKRNTITANSSFIYFNY